MPHQCVRCGHLYDDGSSKVLEGCSCGGRFFFFVKKQAVDKSTEIVKDLTVEDKNQIEKDVMDIIGIKEEDDQPVILDLESINIDKAGGYNLDLVRLFKRQPLVYKLEEGKYIIDVASTFQISKKN